MLSLNRSKNGTVLFVISRLSVYPGHLGDTRHLGLLHIKRIDPLAAREDLAYAPPSIVAKGRFHALRNAFSEVEQKRHRTA
jgi:hypothetical protein